MADESDVLALLAQMAHAAVYPNGDLSPSVTGSAIRVFEGWPTQICLDGDILAGNAEVSIFPQMGGSTASVPQYLDNYGVTVAPVRGLVTTVANDVVTVAGAPLAGEFLSITLDGRETFSRGGSTVAAILAALAFDAAADYPAVAVVGSTISFPGSHFVEARSGAPGVIGTVTHRQKMVAMITVWAPTPAARSTISAAIDVALKDSLRLIFPDGSQGVLRYQSSRISDERVNAGIYRRDLLFEVEYATLATRQAVEITNFGAALDVGPSQLGHVANVTLSSEGQTP